MKTHNSFNNISCLANAPYRIKTSQTTSFMLKIFTVSTLEICYKKQFLQGERQNKYIKRIASTAYCDWQTLPTDLKNPKTTSFCKNVIQYLLIGPWYYTQIWNRNVFFLLHFEVFLNFCFFALVILTFVRKLQNGKHDKTRT